LNEIQPGRVYEKKCIALLLDAAVIREGVTTSLVQLPSSVVQQKEAFAVDHKDGR
jgi:hypothetical protein